MHKQYSVYIMTNKHHTVFYTGITSDLKKRVWEHKQGLVKGFTRKYNIIKLVYNEVFGNVLDAITREKRIKGGSRKRKIALIESVNKEWRDLYYDL
ncbi:GIY-YIG nuclease family protein [candidate division TA06 bacterium]|uniref:GIY-YIG nuclease family protein n=1 Tax=candidate division TA06 bacterium TaxID=2250710 RepID=A0A523US66_UNCT6|nr:MAG: GIY-YIG nuclease family protein [candidate division TA06 bacterium]